MNKTELLTAMAEASGLAKKDCDAALSAFIDTVEAALKSGDKVNWLASAPLRQKSVLPAPVKTRPPVRPLKSPLPRLRSLRPARRSRTAFSNT